MQKMRCQGVWRVLEETEETKDDGTGGRGRE